jgi:hypothetical protein
MALEVINVGAVPNDGTGDPIRTAYQKCNSNFAEIYSRAQTNPPATLVGTAGDQAGMYAYDSSYFYWCFQDFDGSSVIWGQISSGIIANLVAGNTSVTLANNGNASVNVTGIADVAVFSASGASISNLAVSGTSTFSGNVSAANLLPLANAAYDLGSPALQWNSLYLNGNTIFLGDAEISVDNDALILTSPGGSEFAVGGTGTGNATGSFGNVVATGNITSDLAVANFFIGDGSFLTNITTVSNVAVSQIANGTTILSVASSGAPLRCTVDGVSDVLVINSSNIAVTGAVTATDTITATGNITGGNLKTAAVTITDTGSITGLSTISLTGNANVGNLTTTGSITATGNVSGGNIQTSGRITATGNISGANLSVSTMTVSGNASIGGSMLASSANIIDATSSTSSTTGALLVSGGIGVGANIFAGGIMSATGNVSGGNLTTVGAVTGNGRALTSLNASNLDTGTVPSGRLSGTYTITVSGSATTAGTVTTAAQPNITSVGSLSSLTVTGNITGGNLITAGLVSLSSITKTGSNGVGNIGSSTSRFNTVFATASTALYADLAEMYVSDRIYEAGTVVIFGGQNEITESKQSCDPAVAGVISADPAYLMNSGQAGDYVLPVALSGRVRCRVKGPVFKGQLLVSSKNGHAEAYQAPPVGTVIGKALQDFHGDQGMIEVVVGLH